MRAHLSEPTVHISMCVAVFLQGESGPSGPSGAPGTRGTPVCVTSVIVQGKKSSKYTFNTTCDRHLFISWKQHFGGIIKHYRLIVFA